MNNSGHDLNVQNYNIELSNMNGINDDSHFPQRLVNSDVSSSLLSLQSLSKKTIRNELPITKFIPQIPDSYCFVNENFLSDSFSVDGFVKRNSKRVQSFEQLKEDLTSYLKILKQSMVHLINEDYTEFINLSANLVSFEKSINNIKSSVLKFKDETSQVQSRIEETIILLHAKQYRLKNIRDSKLRLNMILEIIKNLKRFELNMNSISSEMNCSTLCQEVFEKKNCSLNPILDENSILLSRMQMNFDYLLENVDIDQKNSKELLIFELKQKYDTLSSRFYQILENELLFLLSYDLNKLNSEDDVETIVRLMEQIIRIYLLNDNQHQLEAIITKNIVKPYFDQIVCDAYIEKNGVKNMFNNIIEMIDTKCVLLIKVLTTSKLISNDDGSLATFGYEILTTTLWKEFVEYSTVRAQSLFSFVNVDSFQYNYSMTFRFIEEFLHKTGLLTFRVQFEQLESYHVLKSKFNMNVYFFMKLQKIVPTLEKSFTEFRYTSSKANSMGYKMNMTCLIHEHLVRCWQSENENFYIGDLFGYLWKLTLKIIMRFATWISDVSIEHIIDFLKLSENNLLDSNQFKPLIHQLLGLLIHDSQHFIANITSLYKTLILPQWTEYYRRLLPQIQKQNSAYKIIHESSLDESFSEVMTNFQSASLLNLFKLMKSEIIDECSKILDFVNDIPRLYRRTNKEKPSKALTYIHKCCQELFDLIAIMGLDPKSSWKNDYVKEVLNELSLHFKNSTLEVLTSVQKTEDSLKKLKKAKPNASFFRNVSNSMSDDDKIRLQIYYDVMEFGNELTNKLSINVHSIQPYHELSEMVSSLKTLIQDVIC